jgi:hypothetical protein
MIHAETASVADRLRRPILLPTSMAILWSRSSLLTEFWEIVQRFGAWPRASIAEDRKGLRFKLNGVELGRLNWGGQLRLIFGRHACHAIVAERMARVDTRHPGVDSVVLDIRDINDVDRALMLLGFSYLLLDSNHEISLSSDSADTKVSPIPSSDRFNFQRLLL